MTPLSVAAPPEAYVATRGALHRLAVYVISPWRRARTGRIGLRVLPGGFGTPPTPPRGRRLRVEGTALHVEGPGGAVVHPITTLADAAAAAGVAPDLAAADRFDVPAPGDLHAPLDVDPDAAAYLADWFAFGERLLRTVVADAAPVDAASEIQLWPEHFDVATEIGAEPLRIGFGASPGDASHPLPYVYAAPWMVPEGDPFWDAPRHRCRTLPVGDLAGAADPAAVAREFLEECRAHVRSTNGGAR